MAIITNEFLTFSAVGNREDLADVIYNISPTDTPFMAAISKNKATAVKHEWQIDSLSAAAANAQLEGDEASFTAVTATTRAFNDCQISSKSVVVSGTQDSVNKAGRKREIVYQITKRSKELRRDMEFVLTNNQAPATGDSDTARQLRPLEGWYTTNDKRGASGADGSTSAAATDGTQRALTEPILKSALQAAWTSGGTVDMIMVGAFNKTVISSFTGNSTPTIDAQSKTRVAVVDVYKSDFGTQKVIANRFQRDRTLHGLDTNMWAVSYLRPMHTIDLAKTGDSEKGLILAEYTLEARNEAASCVVADLTTS